MTPKPVFAISLPQKSEFLSLFFTNNIFAGNTAPSGGELYAYVHNGTATFTNNTFHANKATNRGGGIYATLYKANDTGRLYNNILHLNIAAVGADLGMYNDGNGDFFPSSVELFYNGFDQSAAGTYIKVPFLIDSSNLNKAGPLFVDAANGDLYLSAGSPCINEGDNDALSCLPQIKMGIPAYATAL